MQYNQQIARVLNHIISWHWIDHNTYNIPTIDANGAKINSSLVIEAAYLLEEHGSHWTHLVCSPAQARALTAECGCLTPPKNPKEKPVINLNPPLPIEAQIMRVNYNRAFVIDASRLANNEWRGKRDVDAFVMIINLDPNNQE